MRTMTPMANPMLKNSATEPCTGNQHRIGLVLGAGAARGWAHIGVIRMLEALGVVPDVICGCSSGAIVGAAHSTGQLDLLADLATSLTPARTLGYMDVSLRGGGLIEGRHVIDFFANNLKDVDLERCGIKFGSVATDLESGQEVWLTEGSILDSVRASIAMPGLMTPHYLNGKWLVDGALTNPLPVPLCRALGADILIGVNLSGDLTSHQTIREEVQPNFDAPTGKAPSWIASWLGGQSFGIDHTRESLPSPAIKDVISNSLYIMQSFITRVRIAADPVDIMITPDVSEIGLMDFHEANRAIEAGYTAAEKVKEPLDALCLSLRR